MFSGSLGDALWTVVAFFILLFVLGKYAWRPLLATLNERRAQIEGQIDALVDQMRELAEHQEFLTRLLEENTESGRPALTEDGDR